MEMGSFIEMQFQTSREYWKGEDVARLNSGRAAIYHAIKVYGVDKVYLPYCMCNSVSSFLEQMGIEVLRYFITETFEPTIQTNPVGTAIVLVNYFGVLGTSRMKNLASRFRKVIIDNSQAFFAVPIENCMNIYSPRKFIGCPDGGYVIGHNAATGIEEYEQDKSSDTSLFLLQRIEHGCQGRAYEGKLENDARIEAAGVKRMSRLTHSILDGTDYELVKYKRRANFDVADACFDSSNLLDVRKYYSESCVPMVYPYFTNDTKLIEKFLVKKHYQGSWWSNLKNVLMENSTDRWIAEHLVPITIDQRYSPCDIIKLACYAGLRSGGEAWMK